MIRFAKDDLDDLEGAGGGGREKIKFEYRNPKSETIFKTQIKQIRNGKRRSKEFFDHCCIWLFEFVSNLSFSALKFLFFVNLLPA